MGLIPESGRSPAGGHGNPLQYSCLENPMNRGAWRAGLKRLSTSTSIFKNTEGQVSVHHRVMDTGQCRQDTFIFCLWRKYICINIYMCMSAKLLQSCLTLYDPMDCSLPGSSVLGILQQAYIYMLIYVYIIHI